ncbi:MAG TPA: hypothetical protein VFN13_05395 [Rudaea sp.]|nr:hypothetical protein [Rudaea sp.]
MVDLLDFAQVFICHFKIAAINSARVAIGLVRKRKAIGGVFAQHNRFVCMSDSVSCLRCTIGCGYNSRLFGALPSVNF